MEAVRHESNVNAELARQALDHLVHRHEVLRVHSSGGEVLHTRGKQQTVLLRCARA
jgi:hypothetical protein